MSLFMDEQKPLPPASTGYCRCVRCGWEWWSRKKKPKRWPEGRLWPLRCPHCKSKVWEGPRKEVRGRPSPVRIPGDRKGVSGKRAKAKGAGSANDAARSAGSAQNA